MNPFYNYNYFPMFIPFIPPNCDKPPTLYSILNSIVNGMKDEEDYTKIKNLAKEGRTTIFDFDYPLTLNITKEKFECMILNHFLQRRIGFETVTAFKIQLDVKLNEIMPIYNKMFDALENWDIFESGEVITKTGEDNKTSESTNNTANSLSNTSTSSNISDRKYSDTPENKITQIQNGEYVTDYNYDTNSSSDNSTSNGTSQAINKGKDDTYYTETTTRSPADKIAIMKEMQENIKSIYTMIFKDLDCLFYQLI